MAGTLLTRWGRCEGSDLRSDAAAVPGAGSGRSVVPAAQAELMMRVVSVPPDGWRIGMRRRIPHAHPSGGMPFRLRQERSFSDHKDKTVTGPHAAPGPAAFPGLRARWVSGIPWPPGTP